MTRRVLTLCFTLSVLTFSAVAAESPDACRVGAPILDAKYGFREVKFGLRSKDIARLRSVPQEQYKTKLVTAYVRDREELTLFGQKVSSVTYFFFKDQLFSIQIDWGGLNADGVAILSGFKDAFGCDFAPGQPLALRVRGDRVSFEAVYVVHATGAVGRVTFDELAASALVASAIQAEAAAQF